MPSRESLRSGLMKRFLGHEEGQSRAGREAASRRECVDEGRGSAGWREPEHWSKRRELALVGSRTSHGVSPGRRRREGPKALE